MKPSGRQRASLCVAAAATLIAGTGVAHAGTFDVSVGATNRLVRSASFDALTADAGYGTFSLGAGARVATLAGGAVVRADLQWDAGAATGVMFQRIATRARTHHLLGGARFELPPMLQTIAFARAGLGVVHEKLTLDPDGGGARLSDARWRPEAHAAIGLESSPLKTPSGVGLGVRVEVGYSAIAAAALDAAPEDGGGELAIPAMHAPLGSLDLSAWNLRIGAVISF
jgi:hypothetical protein